MLDKFERINFLISSGVEFVSNQSKRIAARFFGIRYSKCCRAPIKKYKKGIQVEVCSECGKVHCDPRSALKRS